MKQIWFKQFGWVYIPTHVTGIIITVLAIIFFDPNLYGCYTEWSFSE